MIKPNISYSIYLPEKVLTNEELENRKIALASGRFLTANGIKEKIGVEKRHIAENETVNWGGEVGFAYGLGKKIIALKGKRHDIPLMLRFMAENVVEADDLNDVKAYIEELVKHIKK